jgi:hypothetical protein
VAVDDILCPLVFFCFLPTKPSSLRLLSSSAWEIHQLDPPLFEAFLLARYLAVLAISMHIRSMQPVRAKNSESIACQKRRRCTMKQQYQTFKEFWPFYLSQHENAANRIIHFAGTALVVLIAAAAVLSQHWLWLLATPFAGYGPAWIGHFFFEKNRPATFRYPVWSLVGDFRMFWELLLGRLKFCP